MKVYSFRREIFKKDLDKCLKNWKQINNKKSETNGRTMLTTTDNRHLRSD